MAIVGVLIPREAVTDLENGKLFYEEQQRGVGAYFGDSLLSDIESLTQVCNCETKKAIKTAY